MSAGPILRIDDITVAPGHRGHFQDLLRSNYVPAVEALGITIVGLALAPPIDVTDRESDVIVTWQLSDVDAFWRARQAAMIEPRVKGFWESTASLVTRRRRRYALASTTGQSVEDEPATAPSIRGVHHIVLLEVRADVALRLADPPSVAISWMGRHLPGSIGHADASWEFDATQALGADDLAITHARVTDVVVLGDLLGAGARARALRDGIKRTLLLRVDGATQPAAVADFEQDLLSMPRYIPAIRNWRLSRVDSSYSGWTHAWEQEYEDLAGLRDDYMRSPFHWGVVDGWFDADDPRCIVAPELLHLFYEVQSSILA